MPALPVAIPAITVKRLHLRISAFPEMKDHTRTGIDTSSAADTQILIDFKMCSFFKPYLFYPSDMI